jgi:hypothetical protein
MADASIKVVDLTYQLFLPEERSSADDEITAANTVKCSWGDYLWVDGFASLDLSKEGIVDLVLVVDTVEGLHISLVDRVGAS